MNGTDKFSNRELYVKTATNKRMLQATILTLVKRGILTMEDMDRICDTAKELIEEEYDHTT